MRKSKLIPAVHHASPSPFPTTVGVDLGDRHSHFCVLDGQTGRSLEEGRAPTTRPALQKLFARLTPARLVLEVGGQSSWVSRLAEEAGLEVIVANPRKTTLISRNERKNDRTDAELLARLGRMDTKLLSPVRHRSAACQADRAVIRSRLAAVDARTALINHARGLLKSFGYRAPSCSAESFHNRVVEVVPKELEEALLPILRLIGQTSAQIKTFDRTVNRLADTTHAATKALRQVPGVGALTSLAYVLTLEDPRRIRHARQAGPYLGLVPRQDDSGDSSPQLHITKAGDPMMRQLLVLAANYILGHFGPDCDLRRFGLKIAAQGGKNAKKRARVAVARRLAVLLHHLWRTGEVYDPFYLAKRRGEPVPAELAS